MGINKIGLLKGIKNNSAGELIEFLIRSSFPGSSCENPPTYKFYTALVEDLIKVRNRFGAEIRGSLRDVRKALIIDLREEKKIKDAVNGGIFQYLFMCLFIWGFIHFAAQIIEYSGQMEGIEYIFFWQLIGGAGLIFFIKWQKFHLFSPFASYFQAVYQMKLLMGVNRPLSEINASLESIPSGRSKEFDSFAERMELLCTQMKLKGALDMSEVDYLLSELWDQFEIQFLRFMKRLNLVKMVSILVFILPSFFLCIGLIFSQLQVFG